MKRTFWICAASIALAFPAIARADSRPTLIEDYSRGDTRTTVELEAGWYMEDTDDATLHAVTPILGLRVPFTEFVELELDWPTAIVDVSRDDGSDFTRFESGNPLLAVYSVHRNDHGYFRIGAGVAPPVIDLDRDAELGEERLTFASALGMRGNWDPWLYAPDTVSAVIPVQTEALIRGMLLGFDGAGALLIPTDDAIDDDTDLALQGAGLIGAKGNGFTVGARGQVVWVPTGDGDNAQVSVAPFVQADFEQGGFLYSRFVLNIDEPLGVFNEGREVWGLHAGGGARF